MENESMKYTLWSPNLFLSVVMDLHSKFITASAE